MTIKGGCYCGEIRYEADGEPIMKGECHCRECQYITGGQANDFIAMPAEGFRYTKGSPKQFKRTDIEFAAIREFCPNCGTHVVTRSPAMPQGAIVKVGSLDDTSVFGKPDVVMQTADAPSFHHIPEGVPSFERWPG